MYNQNFSGNITWHQGVNFNLRHLYYTLKACGDGSIAITKVKVNRQKSLEIRGLQTNGHVWIRGCWSIFMLWWETYRLMGISESGIGLWLRNGYMVG